MAKIILDKPTFYAYSDAHLGADGERTIAKSYTLTDGDISEMSDPYGCMEGSIIQPINGQAEIMMNNVEFIKSFWKSLMWFRWKKKHGKYSHYARKHKNSFGGKKHK